MQVSGRGVVGVGRNEGEIHPVLMLVVIVPSIARRHIWWQDDSAAAPQPPAGELEFEPSKMS